jgi:hypothetical protein
LPGWHARRRGDAITPRIAELRAGEAVAPVEGMLLRLVMTGCCVVCVLVIARRPPVRVIMSQPPSVYYAPAPAPSLGVVDVASSVAPSAVARLITLGEGEWIAAINEHRSHSAFETASLIDAFARHGGYLDLTVARRGGERRVLVLLH